MTTTGRMRPSKQEQIPRMTGRSIQVRVANLILPQLRLGALIATGLAAFLVGWLVIGGRGDGGQPATSASNASEAELRDFADSAAQPVYWAGPREAQIYELTRTSDGRVYVRYLPDGVKIGDPRAQFLTIGTYPRANAFAELRRAARAEGAVTRELPNGGMLVYSGSKATSVYLGYPGARYQVEVYHPSPNAARDLVLGGQVVPVR